MFGFKKKADCSIYAPADGKVIALEDVPDQVFASKVLGEGIAVEVEGSEICAPCDGRIIMLADTKHAFGLEALNGAEILIHIGLDTVEFNGMGFTALKAVNDRVKKGTPVIKLDREYFRSRNACLITPIIISNGTNYRFELENIGKKVVAKESVVIRFQ
ncbi:PTS sugar transporter subunit IIA [Hungatella sp.]|uniref:PTS sugar transporter subunit IIA n=1 Tax=Hungatella sp. TaxID=2613924 RepID=UPI003AB3B72A